MLFEASKSRSSTSKMNRSLNYKSKICSFISSREYSEPLLNIFPKVRFVKAFDIHWMAIIHEGSLLLYVLMSTTSGEKRNLIKSMLMIGRTFLILAVELGSSSSE